MKFKVLTSIMLFTLALETAFAGWPPKNKACMKAQISELRIHDGTQSTEVCEKSGPMNPAFQAAIEDLSEINHKAAKLFNVELSQLFPEGLAVYISTNYAGLNGSAKASSNLITLENYANPTRWVNKGIYAHELGHTLQFSKSPGIPAPLKATFRSSLLGETIADTIAMSLVGEDTSHEPNLPLCFSQKRVSYDQTYVSYAGNFDSYFQLNILSACCAEYSNFSPATNNICENILTDEGGERIELPPFDTAPFNYIDKSSFEEHRIGIPINSFLLTLGQQVDRDLFREFLQSYFKLDPIVFNCKLNGSYDLQEKVTVSAWTLKTQLQILRSSLSKEEKINYDVQWSKQGLQAAIIMDDADIATRTAYQAEKLFIDAIRKNRTLFKDKQHCAGIFENAETDGYPDNSCDIKCTKKIKLEF